MANSYEDIGLSANLQSLTGPVSQSSPTGDQLKEYIDNKVNEILRPGGLNYTNIISSGRVYTAIVDTSNKGGAFTNIQDAINYINSLGGGTVFIKSGTYVINSDITLYSNINLVGEDNNLTIFDFDGGEKMVIVNDKTNIEISSIHFTGYRYISRTPPSGYYPPGPIYLTHTNASGLLTDMITITDCKFTDNYNSVTYGATSHYSIAATYADRVVVRDCIFNNTTGVFMGGTNMEVSSNRFLNMPKESIYLITTGGEISSNVFDTCVGAAVTSADDIENTVISFNKVINHAGVGFSFSGGFDYCILSNNTGEGDAGSTDFILIGSQANNSVISNNCATGFGGDGIDINGGDKLVINGNSLDNNGAYGINIQAGSVSNLVHGNILDTNTSGGINDAGTSTTLADNVTI